MFSSVVAFVAIAAFCAVAVAFVEDDAAATDHDDVAAAAAADDDDNATLVNVAVTVFGSATNISSMVAHVVVLVFV